MKPWRELSERGRLGRLKVAAIAALDAYDLEVARVSLVGGFVNAVFRADLDHARSGRAAVAVRVERSHDHPDADADIELSWLAELVGADFGPELGVVEPIRSRDGALYVRVDVPGVPKSRRCTVFGWVGGRPLADQISEDSYRRLGRLSAELHKHGASYRPAVRPMAWDEIFYWPESIDPVVIDEPDSRRHFTDHQWQVLERARSVVQPAFDRLAPEGAQICHGDLHPWNVHRIRNRLIALDFEDVMWAHPVQDIAITLSYFMHHPERANLVAAFEEGYTELAPWPEAYAGQIDHFVVARRLMFVNMLLNEGNLSDYLPTWIPLFEAFLATRD
jgi:Ser/Thr protein kinase RdoA (MazF antagonist)